MYKQIFFGKFCDTINKLIEDEQNLKKIYITKNSMLFDTI